MYTSGHQPSVPMLYMRFDSGLLGVLRATVRIHACRAGFSGARTEDVVLAVHELAANAIQHGGGTGRLRMWTLGGALHCQVDDGDPRGSADPAEDAASAWLPVQVNSPPGRLGYGLWVVWQLSDRMRVLPGARGTRVTASFGLRGSRGAHRPTL